MNSLKFTCGKWVHGMADVTFEDYTIEVQSKIADAIEPALEECAGEVISRTKRNSRVDTGKTKSSFQYKVIGSIFAGEYRAYMGSNDENSIWEEFGTGEYALQGNGRKDGWTYKDEKGDWHYTTGKKPSRAFWKAYTSLKNKIIKRLQNSLKGL